MWATPRYRGIRTIIVTRSVRRVPLDPLRIKLSRLREFSMTRSHGPRSRLPHNVAPTLDGLVPHSNVRLVPNYGEWDPETPIAASRGPTEAGLRVGWLPRSCDSARTSPSVGPEFSSGLAEPGTTLSIRSLVIETGPIDRGPQVVADTAENWVASFSR